MATYEGLSDYLGKRQDRELVIALDEIERIIGTPLPASARKRPQYWANVVNDAQRSPANRAAKEAGYSAFLILGLQQVRFVRD